MAVAGCKFRPGVTDADDGLSFEFVSGYSLVSHPGAVYETIFTFFSEPVLAAQLFFHGK